MSFLLTDAMLPATLNCQPMTDHEFTELCREHPDLFFEMTEEGELVVIAPTDFKTGASNAAIGQQLEAWARHDGRGFACASSAGFVLPNGARRSPDASWTLKDRISQLPNGGRKGFWPLCPDFVLEFRSENSRLKPIREKMLEYAENGAQLGWLIDPTDQSVTIYRPKAKPETRTNIDIIQGEGPVSSFILNLDIIWNPLS